MMRLFSAVLVAGVAASSNTTNTTSTTTASGTTSTTTSAGSTEVMQQTFEHQVTPVMKLDNTNYNKLKSTDSRGSDCKLIKTNDYAANYFTIIGAGLKTVWDSTISGDSETEVTSITHNECLSSRIRRRGLQATNTVTLVSDYSVTFLATGADASAYKAAVTTGSTKSTFETNMVQALTQQIQQKGFSGIAADSVTSSATLTIKPAQSTTTTTAGAFRQVTSAAVGVLVVALGLSF